MDNIELQHMYVYIHIVSIEEALFLPVYHVFFFLIQYQRNFFIVAVQ